MDRAVPGFGALLRRWRQHRGLTQLALAHEAEVSTRHLSWLETGRSEPSRAMLMRLAECLELPLRERNTWLRAAGYAALYAEHTIGDAALAPVRETVQRLLDAHAPYPALAVDGRWQLVAHNRIVPMLLQGLPPALTTPPVNVLRLSLHPQGLAPRIRNLPAWRAHLLARLDRQARRSGDPALQRLLDELRGYGPAAGDDSDARDTLEAGAELALPLWLDSPAGPLHFLSTVTVFGAPHDVAVAELAIETLLPADAATAERLRALDEGRAVAAAA